MTNAPVASKRKPALRAVLLRVWRLGALVIICWLIRDQHVRSRVQGDQPVTVSEVEEFFPKAALLRPDHSDRQGMFVQDVEGRALGYVVRTSPQADRIKGYAGPTDVLIAFDNEWKVVGITVHHSDDTRTHVQDVMTDRHFRKSWKGRTWDETANLDLKAAGVEGVSGATKTSMAMAESVVHRLKSTNDQLAAKPRWQIRVRDLGLVLVVAGACWLAFSRKQGRRKWRMAFQVVVVAYVGLINGDLIAQSLLMGWARAGVAFQAAPGLVLFVAAAFMVPWTANKPLYCMHICPHGAAQEWAGRLLPQRFRRKLDPEVASGLRWLPPLLLGLVVFIVMMQVPIDLADVEPFDAWLLRSAGWATITIATLGLVASLFVPQAYCKYGCPTGALLEFVRSHGAQDRFGKRDWAAVVMVLSASVLHWKHDALYSWIMSRL